RARALVSPLHGTGQLAARWPSAQRLTGARGSPYALRAARGGPDGRAIQSDTARTASRTARALRVIERLETRVEEVLNDPSALLGNRVRLDAIVSRLKAMKRSTARYEVALKTAR